MASTLAQRAPLRRCIAASASADRVQFVRTYISTRGFAGAAPHAKRAVSATVVALDDEGDAVAVTDATPRPLRVPFGVPGDALRVEIWEKDAAARHRTPMFAQLSEITTPSAHRVDRPPCAKFFGVCGGCKHQNVVYAEQLAQKQRRVEVGLDGIPLREPVREIRGASELYAYRNKMEFTCSTGRWRLEGDDDAVEGEESKLPTFTLGLFPVSSVGTRRARLQKKRVQWNPRILSIDSCVVQDDACDALLGRIRALCEELEIAAYDFNSHDGFLKNVVLRRGVVEGKREIMAGFVTTRLDGEQQLRFEQLVAKLVAERTDDELVSIVQRVDDEALRHRVKNGELTKEDVESMVKEHVLFGRAFFHDSILDHKFEVSFDSFFQPNSKQASVLYSVVRDELTLMATDAEKKPVVWDLFCGVGSIGICMGPHVSKLIGFELVEAAVERARVNTSLNGYDDKMSFHHLDLSTQWSDVTDRLEQLAGDNATTPDVIIVDPPRAGLHKKLVALLRRLAPPRICYVSCNPQTQARDFALLTAESEGLGSDAAYDVDFVQPVDMLPHTPHIETVAWLTRRDLVSA